MSIPGEIIDWFRDIFAACNRRLAERIQSAPATPEPHLDTTFIEHLMKYSAPRAFKTGWAIQIDTHYLGGMRHFNGWEIADIGVLLFFQRAGSLIRQKVALLQSKRLYPTAGEIDHLDEYDFRIGMARLGQREQNAPSMMAQRSFSFEGTSRYEALRAHDNQYKAISEYIEQSRIPVFYLFYNPPSIPLKVQVPITVDTKVVNNPAVGARVISCLDVAQILHTEKEGYRPSIADLAGKKSIDNHGWRLENFMADLLLRCEEGHRFTDSDSPEIRNLFFRRSGPIAATVAVTVEVPEGTALPD